MTVAAASLIGAALFALGTVLQHRAARSEPETAGAGLLLRLMRRPVWLAGIAADGLGFVCHAVALAAGRLVVVQPLLATSLIFVLPIGAALDRRRVDRRELAGAVVVVAGLAAFLVLADPAGGRDDATTAGWIAAFAVTGAGCLVCWWLARRGSARRRAVLLGTAAGVMYSLSAALIKATVERLDEGVLHVVADWHLWALITVGYLGTVLAQASLQTGALGPAVATQTALDPLVSVALGTLVFGEQIHDTALGAAGALAGVAMMVAGTAALALAEDRAEPARPRSAAYAPARA